MSATDRLALALLDQSKDVADLLEKAYLDGYLDGMEGSPPIIGAIKARTQQEDKA